jgi:hypothetical protein
MPERLVTWDAREARRRAVGMFVNAGLYHHHREWGKPDKRWFQFGFPLRSDSDVLDVLGLVAPYVPADDRRIQEGLTLMLQKQDQDGRWPCEKHPKGGKWMRRYVEFEPIGQPSKWVTLHALRTLKTLCTSTAPFRIPPSNLT